MTIIKNKKPKVGILGTLKGSHVQALADTFHRLQAEPVLIDPKKWTSFIETRKIRLTETDEAQNKAEDLDALVVRSLPGGSLEQVIYRVNALHCLEDLGLRVINNASLIEKTVDKFYTSALLARAGLPVPETIVTERYDQAMEAVKKLGRAVVKPIFGSLGKGIVLLEDLDIAHRVFRALEMGRYVYYIQKYLPHENEDLRIFIVGGEIVGAMRRCGSSWKTNIACGSRAEQYNPSEEIAELALKAAKVLQADYVGLDILISDNQPYIIEANGIPGWQGLQSVTDTDIAEILARYVLGEIKKDEQQKF